MEELINKAKDILEKIPYLTIASVSADGLPMNSPVFAAHDENYNFFWNSPIKAQCSQNLHAKCDVFVVVYDSSVSEGAGAGVYIQGKAFELNEEAETTYALKVFYQKKGKEPRPASDFMNDSPRRMYRLVPEKFWINTYEKINNLPVDKRMEIKLV